jgi:hypothetical protein
MLQKVPVFCDFPLRNRRFGDLIMDNSLPPIQPFDQHRQLRAREPGGDAIPVRGQTNFPRSSRFA